MVKCYCVVSLVLVSLDVGLGLRWYRLLSDLSCLFCFYGWLYDCLNYCFGFMVGFELLFVIVRSCFLLCWIVEF